MILFDKTIPLPDPSLTISTEETREFARSNQYRAALHARTESVQETGQYTVFLIFQDYLRLTCATSGIFYWLFENQFSE